TAPPRRTAATSAPSLGTRSSQRSSSSTGRSRASEASRPARQARLPARFRAEGPMRREDPRGHLEGQVSLRRRPLIYVSDAEQVATRLPRHSIRLFGTDDTGGQGMDIDEVIEQSHSAWDAFAVGDPAPINALYAR